jgi:hypothetical protein
MDADGVAATVVGLFPATQALANGRRPQQSIPRREQSELFQSGRAKVKNKSTVS